MLNISAEAAGEKFERAREKLFLLRERRIHPRKDDKILTDWNGLMIAALAKGAQVLERPDYAETAQQAARFILARMRDDRGAASAPLPGGRGRGDRDSR